MKKIFKKSIIVALMTVFAVTGLNVNAQSDMVITKKDYIYTGNESTGQRGEAKYSTNKGYAFCITPEAKGGNEGLTLHYQSTQKSGGVLYLLDNVGTSDYEYVTTQLAIWLYDSNYLPEFYIKNANLAEVARAKALVNDADENKDYRSEEPRVEISYETNEFELTTDEKYIQTGIMTVNLINSRTATLKLSGAPEGSIIVSENYEKQTTFSNKEKFIVLVPVDEIEGTHEFTLTATAKGTVKSYERYSTGDGYWQDLIVLVEEEKETSTKVKLSVSKTVKRVCEVVGNKYYDKNGDETDKETYLTQCESHKCTKVDDVYFDKDGKVTDEETFEKQCFKHVCDIVDGDYYDANGMLATYDEYKIQCETLVCEIVNGRHFGAYGKEVSEAEFRNQCEAQIVSVPDTKAASIISTIIGSMMLIGVVSSMRKYASKNR